MTVCVVAAINFRGDILSTYKRKEYKEVLDFQLYCCIKYDRKCLTKKCPMRGLYCYEVPITKTLSDAFGARRKIIKDIIINAMKHWLF